MPPDWPYAVVSYTRHYRRAESVFSPLTSELIGFKGATVDGALPFLFLVSSLSINSFLPATGTLGINPSPFSLVLFL